MNDVDAIRKRCEALVEVHEEWVAAFAEGDYLYVVDDEPELEHDSDYYWTVHAKERAADSLMNAESEIALMHKSVAEFIAHAREDIPVLLDEVAALREGLAKAETLLSFTNLSADERSRILSWREKGKGE